MAKIIFRGVGRGKWCGEVSLGEVNDVDRITEVAYREAEKHLASRFPDVTYDPNTNTGKIFAGYHCAGEFSVEEEPNG